MVIFLTGEYRMRRLSCSCVNTPLTVVTIQALLKTAHKQQRRAKDAYRGSKCIWRKALVLLEEAAVHSGESQALCWFITLLDLVTEIRTSMFQSDSWPLRFTHPTSKTPTVATVFQAHRLTYIHADTKTVEYLSNPVLFFLPQKSIKIKYRRKVIFKIDIDQLA